MLLNGGVGEDSWKSLGPQGDQTVNPKGNQSWILIGRTDAEAPLLGPPAAKKWLVGKDLMLVKIEGRRQGWQRMRWFMASPTWWTWVWACSQSWWWTGKPGLVQSMGFQRVRYNWATELNWLAVTLHSLSIQFQATINLLSLSGFAYSGLAHKWNPTLCGLLWLASFI